MCAPEPLVLDGRPSVFLAGPTPRAAEVASWRPEALDWLRAAGFSGVVLDPERRVPVYDYDVQIDWEHDALTAADAIVFWVPRELVSMPAFTTNVEFGLWISSGKVAAGAPPSAPKNRYLAATAARHGVRWCDTLDEVLARGVAIATAAASRR